MNKKVYQDPKTIIVIVQTQHIIAATTVKETQSNVSITYGGGGSGAALSRGGDWDDEEGE